MQIQLLLDPEVAGLGQHHVCVRVPVYGVGFAEGLVKVKVVVQAGVKPEGQAVPGYASVRSRLGSPWLTRS